MHYSLTLLINKYANSVTIQTITNELTKAYSEMSQLLALTKLCNDKNPGIILKNCLRPSMQQIGVELLPESIIEHKRNYFSTSKTDFTNALNNSRVVASEHRLFFQCTKKLMKYWNIVVLNQAQKSLLQYKAPNKIFKIAIGTYTQSLPTITCLLMLYRLFPQYR